MDHLAEQVHILILIFFQGPVADLDGVFHTITKTEMPGKKKLHRPKVKNGRRKILLAMVFGFARFFYSSGDGRSVVNRYFKFLNGN
jgi:hypothetical protein